MTSPEVAALLKRREEINRQLEAAIALDWLKQYGKHPSHKVTIVLAEGSAVGGAREAGAMLQKIAQGFLNDIVNQAMLEVTIVIGKVKP